MSATSLLLLLITPLYFTDIGIDCPELFFLTKSQNLEGSVQKSLFSRADEIVVAFFT